MSPACHPVRLSTVRQRVVENHAERPDLHTLISGLPRGCSELTYAGHSAAGARLQGLSRLTPFQLMRMHLGYSRAMP